MVHNEKVVKKLLDISKACDGDSYKIDIASQGWENQGCHKILLKNVSDDKIVEIYSYIAIKSLNFTVNGNYAFANIQTGVAVTIGGECFFSSILGRHEDYTLFKYWNGEIKVLLPTIKWHRCNN